MVSPFYSFFLLLAMGRNARFENNQPVSTALINELTSLV